MWELSTNQKYNLILLFFIIATFISTIFLVVQSSKNDNTIGRNMGYTIMVFLLILPFSLYLVGEYFFEYYNIVFVFVFGILIFFVAIILLIGLSNNNENFTNSQGICFQNGKQGYIINGVCDITNQRNCEVAVQQSIRETCPQSAGSGTRSTGTRSAGTRSAGTGTRAGTSSQESFAQVDATTLGIGLCSYIDNSKTVFGYRHPQRGAACISKDKMLLAIKDSKQVLPGISYSANPFQSTTCLKYPKTDYISFDIECKKKFGLNYGLKLIENQGCAQNDYRAVCEAGYQAGIQLPEESTKCVPVGKDMNMICQTKHVENPGKFGKYLRVGYKTIEFSGCPRGSQRAICNGNYYDGKELFEKTTAPFPQTENANRKCQAQFGLLSFSKRIISENCSVGYVRAECN
jgi:hypothetical protein